MMDISSTGGAASGDDGGARTWSKALRGRAAKAHIPLSATLELTSRCNLRCRHCYLGEQEEQHRKRAQERGTAEVMASLDAWAEAGCLFLLITGGDPMMRRDFAEIYRHARELGMLVTVFCDGILVTERILALFKELPPLKVEISIYGATAVTYENVTRVPGSHAHAWTGIRRLRDSGIRVTLKTVLLTLNQHELAAMAAQAAEIGCDFRFDSSVFPCLSDSAAGPVELRLSPEEAVRLDMVIPKFRDKWVRQVHIGRELGKTDNLYACGAGSTSFYADPYGNLSPCLMTSHLRYPGQGREFIDVWHLDIGDIRSKKRTKSNTSLSGEMRGACTHCPAFNRLETGDEETESDYMKTTTRLRYEAVMAIEARKGAL